MPAPAGSQPGHGLDDYLAKLNAIDGRRVDVWLGGTDAQSKAEFDRRVRESVDRQHRKRMIAER